MLRFAAFLTVAYRWLLTTFSPQLRSDFHNHPFVPALTDPGSLYEIDSCYFLRQHFWISHLFLMIITILLIIGCCQQPNKNSLNWFHYQQPARKKFYVQPLTKPAAERVDNAWISLAEMEKWGWCQCLLYSVREDQPASIEIIARLMETVSTKQRYQNKSQAILPSLGKTACKLSKWLTVQSESSVI